MFSKKNIVFYIRQEQNIFSTQKLLCYDTGHENCYHPTEDCLSRYGNRLFSIHIDDNFGDGDTHLLPFDGNVNWNKVCEQLNKSKPIEYLTLEVDFNVNHEYTSIYKDLSAVEFLTLAYKKLQTFSDKIYQMT